MDERINRGPEARSVEAPRAPIVITVFGPRRPIAVEIIFEAAADIETIAVDGEEVDNPRRKAS